MFHTSKYMNHSQRIHTPSNLHYNNNIANNELNNLDFIPNKMTQGGPPPIHDSCGIKSALLKSNGMPSSNGDNFMFPSTDPADFHINKNVLIEPLPMSCPNSYMQSSLTRSRSPSPIISDGDSGYNSSKQMSPVSLVSFKFVLIQLVSYVQNY